MQTLVCQKCYHIKVHLVHVCLLVHSSGKKTRFKISPRFKIVAMRILQCPLFSNLTEWLSHRKWSDNLWFLWDYNINVVFKWGKPAFYGHYCIIVYRHYRYNLVKYGIIRYSLVNKYRCTVKLTFDGLIFGGQIGADSVLVSSFTVTPTIISLCKT